MAEFTGVQPIDMFDYVNYKNSKTLTLLHAYIQGHINPDISCTGKTVFIYSYWYK